MDLMKLFAFVFIWGAAAVLLYFFTPPTHSQEASKLAFAHHSSGELWHTTLLTNNFWGEKRGMLLQRVWSEGCSHTDKWVTHPYSTALLVNISEHIQALRIKILKKIGDNCEIITIKNHSDDRFPNQKTQTGNVPFMRTKHQTSVSTPIYWITGWNSHGECILMWYSYFLFRVT